MNERYKPRSFFDAYILVGIFVINLYNSPAFREVKLATYFLRSHSLLNMNPGLTETMLMSVKEKVFLNTNLMIYAQTNVDLTKQQKLIPIIKYRTIQVSPSVL